VRLEGLGQLKKIHLIGTRTHDLPACSIVPQPTTLPRAPQIYGKIIKLDIINHRANKNEQEKMVMGIELESTKSIHQQEKEQKV
jgi:hypothetical protein